MKFFTALATLLFVVSSGCLAENNVANPVGATTIRLHTGSVKNILRNTQGSHARLKIGGTKNASVNAVIDSKTRNVNNTIMGGRNNYAEVSIGSIENDSSRARQSNRPQTPAGAYASTGQKKEFLDPAKSSQRVSQIRKADSLSRNEKNQLIGGRSRAEGYFENAANRRIAATTNAFVRYKNGKISKTQYDNLMKAIKNLDAVRADGKLSLDQYNVILGKSNLDTKTINAEIEKYDKQYMDLRKTVNAKNSGKNAISIGSKDQALVVPVNGNIGLGVKTKEVFGSAGAKGQVTRSQSVNDIKSVMKKVTMPELKKVAAGLDLTKKRDIEIAKRILGAQELLDRSLQPGGKLSQRMQTYFTQFAVSDLGAKKISDINNDFDKHIQSGDLEKVDDQVKYHAFYVVTDKDKRNGDVDLAGKKFFEIRTSGDKFGASANKRYIELGNNFRRTIPISGEYIMGPEIIYHEFGHTRYGTPISKTLAGRALGQNEAYTVKQYENRYRASFGWPKRNEYCYSMGCIDLKDATP